MVDKPRAVEIDIDDPETQARFRASEAKAEARRKAKANGAGHPHKPFEYLTADRIPQPQLWSVRDHFPARSVSLFSARVRSASRSLRCSSAW